MPALPRKLVPWFQKRWKRRFRVFYFKNFLGEHSPPDPLGACAFGAREAPYGAKKKIRVRCFQKYVRYFTKQLKTLLIESDFTTRLQNILICY